MVCLLTHIKLLESRYYFAVPLAASEKNAPLRICLISREYPPETGWGGIATFANHLACGLVALGHEVEVVALAKDKAKTVKENGITIHRVEPHSIEGDLGAVALCMPYSRYVLRTTTALWKKFLELHQVRPFDVVDTPELLAEGLIPAVTKAVPLLVRLYTPHSKFIAEQLHNVTASFDHQFVALLERVAMLSADVLTSPSDDLADFVAADLQYPRQEIALVRNPIDPEKFCPEGARAIESDGRRLVLFIGRLEERKGINYLVEAIPAVLASHPETRFVIVGDDTNNAKGQTSVLAELKESITRHNCGHAVEFLPRVPLADLPKYYRSADICVVPSVYDNSPYTCLEAMSCGRPVVGTSSGGTREYIVDGQSGIIIPPRDPAAIAGALTGLLADEEERRRLGANARARVLEKFDRKEIARQTAELYRQAVSRYSRRCGQALYMKTPGGALSDAESFLYAYDKALYDFLYSQSIAFRIKHWWLLSTRRPRLTLAILFTEALKSLRCLPGAKNKQFDAVIARMDKAVHARRLSAVGNRALATSSAAQAQQDR